MQLSSKLQNDSIALALPDLTHIADDFDEERLQQMELNATDPTQEILSIAKSVHELSTLSQELSVLVLEQTLNNQAYKHQKRSRATLCINMLVKWQSGQ